MIDKNGYAPSIFDVEDGTCWLCGAVGDTVRHEIYRGKNRTVSKNNGFWLAVCPTCHDRLHTHEYEDEMHRIAQVKYIADGGTVEKFIEMIGRNYL